MGKNLRRRKLVRNDLQLKVVFIAIFVASLVLLLNFQLSLAALWTLSGQVDSNTSVTALLETLRQSLINRFLLTVGLTIPLAAAVGIVYSFKFSGPVYRFNMHFQSLRDGRWDQPCKLRKGDDLVDVCDSINGAMDAVNQVVTDNDRVVRRFCELARNGTLSSSDEKQLQGLLEQARGVLYQNEGRIRRLAPATPVGGSPETPRVVDEETKEEKDIATQEA